MPLYLSRFSYTPETWARLIANPEDRRQAAAAYIESVGGKLHGFWYAFGSHDGVTLWEAPDNVSMAAVALAIGSGGAVTGLETTVPAERRGHDGRPQHRAGHRLSAARCLAADSVAGEQQTVLLQHLTKVQAGRGGQRRAQQARLPADQCRCDREVQFVDHAGGECGPQQLRTAFAEHLLVAQSGEPVQRQ
jgi:uncharacterized protein with GYD domain